MSRQVQLRRGTTAEHSSFTGALGEITIDTDKDVVVVHDGVTAGGFPLVRSLSTLSVTSTPEELNLLDGSQPAVVVNSKAAIYGASGELNATTLQIGGVSITATAHELNYVDGVTSGLQSQLDAKAPLANPTFTGTVNAADMVLTGFLRGPASFTIDPATHGDNTGTVIIAGNLQVDGTTTTINSTTVSVDDINIVLASGAANAAAANGAGITIDGASATIVYSASTDSFDFNKRAILPGMQVDGLTSIEEVIEKVVTDTTTSGTLSFDCLTQGVFFLTSNQAANRTINFRGDSSTTLNSVLAIGESITSTILAMQGATAYYFSVIQVDGSTVTPKWQGGVAPTGGNANSIDAYTFTIIKTASATYTVLAAQVRFA